MSDIPKFSLSFSKKIEKKNLNPSAIRDVPQEQKETTLLIESIEENEIKGDEIVEEELVIPMIELDRGAIFKKLSEKALKRKLLEEIDDKDDSEIAEDASTSDNNETTSNKKPLTLEEQAEAAIIEESKQGVEKWENRSQKDNLTIPVGMPNQEDSLTPIGKESNLDDYDQIGVDHFGPALLRGMGWKKKEGIGGKTGKKVVEIVEPTARQFGQIVTKGKGINESSKDEDVELKKGSYIFIHSGRSRGSYGTVESVDEDHILVRRSMSNDVVREVEVNVRVVTQKEFKDSSRVINKEMYDEYKAKDGMKGKGVKENTEDKSESKISKDEDQHENDAKVKANCEKIIKKEESTSGKRDKISDNDEFTDQTEMKNEKYDDSSKNKDSKYGNKYDRISHGENNRSYKEDREERKDKFKEKQDMKKYGANDDRNYSKKDYKDYDDRKYKDNRDKSDYYKNKNKDYYNDSIDKKYNHDNINKQDKYSKEIVKDKYETHKYDKYERNGYEEKDKYGGKRFGYIDEYKEMKKHKAGKLPAMPWVRENLRVRLINKNFKGGKYHKEKMIVCNIETAESCECITDDGRTLRDINPAWLETVIPKQPPQIVMIVKGQQKGQKGRILELHKSQESASVQMLDDETDLVKLHYDNICEYVRR